MSGYLFQLKPIESAVLDNLSVLGEGESVLDGGIEQVTMSIIASIVVCLVEFKSG